MELTSELDRLELCVKRAFERIDSLQSEKQRLTEEKLQLENRVKGLPKQASAPVTVPPLISPERLSEIRKRLTHLIEEIREYERNL